jgi:hypothetical protein
MSLPTHPSLAGYAEGSWFPWDRALSAQETRAILADSTHPRRTVVIALILREARPDQVWDWLTPAEVAIALPSVERRLGRARPFWRWLIANWRRLGYLA